MSDTTIVGTLGPDTISGGAGNDTIWGDTNTGFTASDTVSVGAGDSISAGSGNDLVYGQGGNDTIAGDAGNDTLFGGVGNDSIAGGTENDSVDGGAGNDTLSGGAGVDTLSYLSASAGVSVDLNNGIATGGAGTDSIGRSGSDTLGDRFEVVVGSNYDDSITGSGNADILLGGAGDDDIYGFTGSDYLDGGDGNDTLTDALGNDTLVGGAGDDYLYGGNGSDFLDGGQGNDAFDVGSANDTALGGAGNDTLTFYSGNSSVDAGSDDDYVSIFGGSASTGNATLLGGSGTDTLDLGDWDGPYGVSTELLQDSVYGAWTVTHDSVTGGARFVSATTTLYGAQFEDVVCFASGTLIATARGEVAVEDLRIGDQLVTVGSRAILQPITWIGHTIARVARHPDRAKVAPVRITAGALGRGVPFRDLRVSPDHALFLDGHLVPAKYLVNGTTVVQELWCRDVTYWHVEMPAHTLLVSDGALTESYLDDGNRKHFDNGAIASLFQDFESQRANGIYDRDACYPVLRGGEKLEAIRAKIAAIAAAPASTVPRLQA